MLDAGNAAIGQRNHTIGHVGDAGVVSDHDRRGPQWIPASTDPVRQLVWASDGRSVRLTPVGELLLPHARQVTAELKHFEHEHDAYPFGRAAAALNEGRQGLYALGYYRQRPCFAPFTHALVDHDGKVYVCCMQRGAPVLGNLNTHSFAQVWSAAEYTAVRAGMRDGARLPACHRCDDFLAPNRQLFELLEPRP